MIDHRPTQLFITDFLYHLKAARSALLQSHRILLMPIDLLSETGGNKEEEEEEGDRLSSPGVTVKWGLHLIGPPGPILRV